MHPALLLMVQDKVEKLNAEADIANRAVLESKQALRQALQAAAQEQSMAAEVTAMLERTEAELQQERIRAKDIVTDNTALRVAIEQLEEEAARLRR